MSRLNVFVTGISGSVGHYLFDLLKDDARYHLYLLVRNPKKLQRDLTGCTNVTLITDDIRTVHKNPIMKQIDIAILIATTWGGFKEPWRINVYATYRIFRSFDQHRLKKILYFSTASILDRDHQPVHSIRTIGTNYIRSKYLAYMMLQKSKAWYASKVTTIFPTWVYGGDKDHPYSHAASGVTGLRKWIWFARFFTFNFKFHFIHCADIAKMTAYLMEHENVDRNLVFGNDAVTVGEFFKQAASVFGYKTPVQIQIPMGLIQGLAKLGRKHPWDEYCLNYKHFVYNTTNCKKLGLPSDVDTVPGLIRSFIN